MPGLGGLASHQVGESECGDAVGDVEPDVGVAPVPHRGEADDLGVFELVEAGFGVELAAVAGDDLGARPVLAVGDQQAFAEPTMTLNIHKPSVAQRGGPNTRGDRPVSCEKRRPNTGPWGQCKPVTCGTAQYHTLKRNLSCTN